MSRHAWAVINLGLSDNAFLIKHGLLHPAGSSAQLEQKFNIDGADREAVAAAWRHTNGTLIADDLDAVVAVRAIDEADMTIYRVCAHFSSSHTTLVLSGDSDMFFIPKASHVNMTVSFRRSNSASRKLLRNPWTLTNVSALHGFTPLWPWSTDEQRIMAALLSGHDYVVGGAAGIGLRRIEVSRICTGQVSPTFETSMNK